MPFFPPPNYIVLGPETTAALCCPSYGAPLYTLCFEDTDNTSVVFNITKMAASVNPPSQLVKL
jgi:hypothetical protein